MKSLARYLLLIFLLTCALLFGSVLIDPPEPVLLIDATPAKADPNAPHLFAPCPLMPSNLPPLQPPIVRT